MTERLSTMALIESWPEWTPYDWLDDDIAEHVQSGWSVGEAEYIVEHDNGWHDGTDMPGCPRCDGLSHDEGE